MEKEHAVKQFYKSEKWSGVYVTVWKYKIDNIISWPVKCRLN